MSGTHTHPSLLVEDLLQLLLFGAQLLLQVLTGEQTLRVLEKMMVDQPLNTVQLSEKGQTSYMFPPQQFLMGPWALHLTVCRM